MPLALGRLETQVLGYLRSRRQEMLRAGELAQALGWGPEQERQVLSRLARKGLLVRVRRGLYLASEHLPLGGGWSPGEVRVLTALMEECGGTYQISGPNAFQRYGWTEQVPNRVCVYNNRISGERQAGPVALTLIKVADERLGGTETVRTPDGLSLVYASRARALVDAVYDWPRFGTLPRAYGWIGQEAAADPGFAADLVAAALSYGNQGTRRRIGAVLERLRAPEPLLRRLERGLHRTASLIPMNPAAPKRGRPGAGKTSSRWGVVFNHD